MLPTVHYNMGGLPTNFHAEVLTKKGADTDAVVPGLMAMGEAACVSVHGANRLGSNSLIDLVVFGRAAGLRCAELVDAKEVQAELPKDAGDLTLPRASTITATPMAARRPPSSARAMQRVMQANCAVFRTGEVLQEGHKLIHEVWDGIDDIHVTDRSLIWNSDRIDGMLKCAVDAKGLTDGVERVLRWVARAHVATGGTPHHHPHPHRRAPTARRSSRC